MRRTTPIGLAVLIACAALPPAAEATSDKCKLNGSGIDPCVVLRAPAAEIPAIAQQHGLTVVEGLSASDPDVVLAEGPTNVPVEDTVAALAADPDVVDAEAVMLASLGESEPGTQIDLTQLADLDAIAIDGVYSGSESAYFSASAWNGYMQQPAVALIKLQPVRNPAIAETYGTGVVAVIDTGVDPDHPLLQGALVPGYDFLIDQAGIASEWEVLDPATRDQTQQDLESFADQSYSSIVEGSGDTALMNDSTETIVDQSYSSIVEQSYSSIVEGNPLPAAFGHGTMVAGLVRLMAPGAQIMPIRIFDGDGRASTADVLKAIYFAIDNGANVINMSFSMSDGTRELERAVAKAKSAGLVGVSSTGNQASQSLTYPAALGYVLGVAATDTQDALSSFSNYGLALAAVGAPGEALVSLYPGGLYAGGWGTSFSTALVSGSIALLHDLLSNGSLVAARFGDADRALEDSADPPNPPTPPGAIGYGRLDVDELWDYGRYNGSN